MRRSEINRYIAEADAFFAENSFALPPYAHWTLEEWRQHQFDTKELRTQRLGWDLTDFNQGQFERVGLTLFTLRNGSSAVTGAKPYAEKIMHVRVGQVTPFHYHARKTEDIINRGGRSGGHLVVQLYHLAEGGGFSKEPVRVSCDGIARMVDPGGVVTLGPGESVTLAPYLYHQFYAADEDCLVGEVSSVNDDDADNFFRDPIPRYPEIVEDELPFRLLCTEYEGLRTVPAK